MNFNLNPKPGEILTSINVDIYVKERYRPLLIIAVNPRPSQGKLYSAYILNVPIDADTYPVYMMPFAYKDNNVEFSIPIGLIKKFTRCNRIELLITSMAKDYKGRFIDGGDELEKITYEL